MPGGILLLPLAAAILGLGAFLPIGAWWLAFLFPAAILIFYLHEEDMGRLIAGTAAFRLLFAAGVVPFSFEPIGWLASILVFLGLPVSFYIVRRRAGAIPALAAAPALWTLWDIAQARFSFLPTYAMTAGNALGASPLVGLASFGGISGLTLFAASVAALIAAAARAPGRRTRSVCLAAAFAAVMLGWFVSDRALGKGAAAYAARSNELGAAIVSTGVDFAAAFQDLPDALGAGERALISDRLSATLRPLANALRGGSQDLLILPEDFIDVESWGDTDPEGIRKFGIQSGGVLIRAYRSLAQELAVNVSVAFTTIQDDKRYNSALLFDRRGELIGRYNKARLAIGGEYWPFGDWRPPYWNLIARARPEIAEESPLFHPAYRYTAGEPAVLAADVGFAFASPICIEGHDPPLLEEFRRLGASFVVHTSNNGWITLGLGQYLRVTDNLRTIEAVRLGIPIVVTGRGERASIITPDGALSASPPPAAGGFTILRGTLRW